MKNYTIEDLRKELKDIISNDATGWTSIAGRSIWLNFNANNTSDLNKHLFLQKLSFNEFNDVVEEVIEEIINDDIDNVNVNNANQYIRIYDDSSFTGFKVIKGEDLTRADVDGLFTLERSDSDSYDFNLVVW